MKDISLLIGNGFNRLEDNNFPNWDTLIKTPVAENKNYLDIKNMSYPLKFEYIVNFCNDSLNKHSEDTYIEIKKTNIRKIESKHIKIRQKNR